MLSMRARGVGVVEGRGERFEGDYLRKSGLLRLFDFSERVLGHWGLGY